MRTDNRRVAISTVVAAVIIVLIIIIGVVGYLAVGSKGSTSTITQVSTQVQTTTALTTSLATSVATTTAVATSVSTAVSTSVSTTTATSSTTASNATLTAGFTGDVTALNPLYWFTINDLDVLQMVYNTLVEANSSGLPTAGVATSWTISPDGTVYTFNIVQNGMWQDGQPITANDVAFTLNEWVKFNPPYYTALSGAIAKANATGTYTVVVTLKHADPGFLLDLADLGMIVPQHIWASITTPKNATNLVGDGPFSFVSRTPGVDIILKANPTYWLGPPHYGYLVIKIFNSVDAAIAAVQSGSLNLYELPPGTNLGAFASYANVQVLTTPSTMIWYDSFNTQMWPFNITLVRQAVAYAINHQDIIGLAFSGQGNPAGSALSPALSYWYNGNVNNYTENLNTSVADLRAAGFTNSSDSGPWKDAQGRSLAINLYIANVAPYVQWANVIEQDLAHIGITVTIQAVDSTTWTNTALLQHNYQMTEGAWRLYFDPMLFLEPSFHSIHAVPNDIDFSLFSNSTVDSLITQAENQTTLGSEKVLVNQIQTDVAQQVPWVMESYGQDIWALQGFSGVHAIPRYGLWYYSTFLSLTPEM
jgi:peptide/nickel transport system substrate-binding protein